MLLPPIIRIQPLAEMPKTELVESCAGGIFQHNTLSVVASSHGPLLGRTTDVQQHSLLRIGVLAPKILAGIIAEEGGPTPQRRHEPIPR